MACLIELTLMGQHDGEDHGSVIVNMDCVEHFRSVKESEIWMTGLFFKGYGLYVKENYKLIMEEVNNYGN